MLVRTILVAASLLASSAVQSEELFSYFTMAEDQSSVDLTISPCQEDEVVECVAHSLSCGRASSSSWSDAEFTIIYGNVEKIVTTLLVGSEGRAEANLILGEGATSVTVQIPSIRIESNDMDVAWMLTLDIGNSDVMFDAITKKSSEDAKLIVGGESFTLAPQAGDGSKLMKFKEACIQSRQ